MYRQFFNVDTGNAIKIFDAGGVPEKHIINFLALVYKLKFTQSHPNNFLKLAFSFNINFSTHFFLCEF